MKVSDLKVGSLYQDGMYVRRVDYVCPTGVVMTIMKVFYEADKLDIGTTRWFSDYEFINLRFWKECHEPEVHYGYLARGKGYPSRAIWRGSKREAETARETARSCGFEVSEIKEVVFDFD